MHSTVQHHRIRGPIPLALITVLLAAAFAAASPAATYAQGAPAVVPSSVTAAPGTAFNSNFNTNHNGWIPVYGSWSQVNSAYYRGLGVAGNVSSIKHTGTYSKLNYQARLYRAGACVRCDMGLIIRGQPNSLSPQQDWQPEYWFAYTNNQYFHVWYIAGTGNWQMLKDWTFSSAIVSRGWNVPRVTAVGSSLKFYINGTLVWAVNNALPGAGQVGIGFYRDSSTGNYLYVDSASLGIPSATAAVNPEVEPQLQWVPGTEVSAGMMHLSP